MSSGRIFRFEASSGLTQVRSRTYASSAQNFTKLTLKRC